MREADDKGLDPLWPALALTAGAACADTGVPFTDAPAPALDAPAPDAPGRAPAAPAPAAPAPAAPAPAAPGRGRRGACAPGARGACAPGTGSASAPGAASASDGRSALSSSGPPPLWVGCAVAGRATPRTRPAGAVGSRAWARPVSKDGSRQAASPSRKASPSLTLIGARDRVRRDGAVRRHPPSQSAGTLGPRTAGASVPTPSVPAPAAPTPSAPAPPEGAVPGVVARRRTLSRHAIYSTTFVYA
ncbi:hypothetical protein EH183_43020 [Streptomyces sp. CB01881]|nr:hypothetical protein EH183_43020 [Streptomyces sp. CB01881]